MGGLKDIFELNKSEIERQISYYFTYMWNLKKTKQTTKQKQAHRYREQIDNCQDEFGG